MLPVVRVGPTEIAREAENKHRSGAISCWCDIRELHSSPLKQGANVFASNRRVSAALSNELAESVGTRRHQTTASVASVALGDVCAMISSFASENLPTLPSGSVAERKSLTRRIGPCVNVNSRGSRNSPDGRSIRSNLTPGLRLMSMLTAPGSQPSVAAVASPTAPWRAASGWREVMLGLPVASRTMAAARVRVVAIG